MPILDKNNKELVEKYNKFLNNNNASIMQDLRWSNVKPEWIHEVIYLEEDNNIIASMSILIKKLPIIKSYLLYGCRGPVCDIKDIDLVNRLVKEADVLVEKYNGFVLKFDPEITSEKNIEKLYIKNGYNISINDDELIQPRHNMILNIENKTEDELLKQFSEKTRYNIRLADRKGVKVRYSIDLKDLDIFYKLYEVTTIRDNIGRRAFSYFKKLVESFDTNEVRIYIAEFGGIPLASAITLNYGSKVFYIYGASSNEKRNLMPNYLMQWEMIKWGIETNCKLYDFGGVFEFTNKNGLYKFKSGFCKEEGVTEYIGEIDKVYNSSIYYCYTKVIPFIKNVRTRIRQIGKKNN